MKIIDTHTHGIAGSDTRSGSVTDVLRIADIQGSCGVSEIVLSICPGAIDSMRRQMETVRLAMEAQRQQKDQGTRHEAQEVRSEEKGRGNQYSTPDAGFAESCILDPVSSRKARILGVHLEGPFLNRARCGALDPRSFIEPEGSALSRLLEGFEGMVKNITVAPELAGAPALIKKIAKMGIVVSMGHSDATYGEAEAGFEAGARGITHLFNAMKPFHHREPGLAGFGLLNKQAYVELIADPFHLHIGTLEIIFRTKNREKIIVVSDSVRGTGVDSCRGKVEVAGTLLGGSMTVPESFHRLLQLGFEEAAVADAITINPRRYLMLES
jgi:N-acetylglucosamine-6-phosphate deacetylase